MSEPTPLTEAGRILLSEHSSGTPHMARHIVAIEVEAADLFERQAAALTPPPSLDPHPGEWHEWRTTCLRCGEFGMLNLSIIGPDEQVAITPRAALEGAPDE